MKNETATLYIDLLLITDKLQIIINPSTVPLTIPIAAINRTDTAA